MSMVRCRECGGEVSSQAAVCPHCGISEPAQGVAADAAHRHGTVAGVRGHESVRGHDHVHPPVRRKGGKAGWMMALLLLLVLLALFGLWYGNVVDFN